MDGTGCVVQYKHPLCSDRCSFVKLPADLNGALLLKHREAIRSGNSSPPEKGPRWRRASSGDLQTKRCFPQEKLLHTCMRIKTEGHIFICLTELSHSGVFVYFFFSFTVNRKEQHSWHIHQIHPKATENVIFKFVLLAVCFQKWTWLSKVQHHLSAVQKQKSSSYIFHFCNKTEFSHCHFKHPTDLIVISLACSDSVFAYLHR